MAKIKHNGRRIPINLGQNDRLVREPSLVDARLILALGIVLFGAVVVVIVYLLVAQ